MTQVAISRRQLLKLSGIGLGGVALTWLLNGQQFRAAEGSENAAAFDLHSKDPPQPARAKSAILMMQNGGPSQMDLFDPKPALKKHNGQQHSIKVEMFQTGSEQNKLLDTPFQFRRYGAAGIEMSEVIPHIGSIADELCLVRSMHTGHNNHTEALVMFMTGKIFQGRPSLGSWISCKNILNISTSSCSNRSSPSRAAASKSISRAPTSTPSPQPNAPITFCKKRSLTRLSSPRPMSRASLKCD